MRLPNTHVGQNRFPQQGNAPTNQQFRPQQGGYNGRAVNQRQTPNQFKSRMAYQQQGGPRWGNQAYGARPNFSNNRAGYQPQQPSIPRPPSHNRGNQPQVSANRQQKFSRNVGGQRPANRPLPQQTATKPATKEKLTIWSRIMQLFSPKKGDSTQATSTTKKKWTFSFSIFKRKSATKPAAKQQPKPKPTPSKAKTNLRFPQAPKMQQRQTNQRPIQQGVRQNQPARRFGGAARNQATPVNTKAGFWLQRSGGNQPAARPQPNPSSNLPSQSAGVWSRPQGNFLNQSAGRSPAPTGLVSKRSQAEYDKAIRSDNFKNYAGSIKPQLQALDRLRRSGPSTSYKVNCSVPKCLKGAKSIDCKKFWTNVNKQDEQRASSEGALYMKVENGGAMVRSDVLQKLDILTDLVSLVEAHKDGKEKDLNRYVTTGKWHCGQLKDVADLDAKLAQYEAMSKEILADREHAFRSHDPHKR